MNTVSWANHLWERRTIILGATVNPRRPYPMLFFQFFMMGKEEGKALFQTIKKWQVYISVHVSFFKSLISSNALPHPYFFKSSVPSNQ